MIIKEIVARDVAGARRGAPLWAPSWAGTGPCPYVSRQQFVNAGTPPVDNPPVAEAAGSVLEGESDV